MTVLSLWKKNKVKERAKACCTPLGESLLGLLVAFRWLPTTASEPSELHYCRLRGVDCCVPTLVNFYTPGLGVFCFILSPASFVIMIFNQGD